ATVSSVTLFRCTENNSLRNVVCHLNHLFSFPRIHLVLGVSPIIGDNGTYRDNESRHLTLRLNASHFLLDRRLVAQSGLPVSTDAIALDADQLKGTLGLIDMTVHQLVNSFLVGEDLSRCGSVIFIELADDRHRSVRRIDVTVD